MFYPDEIVALDKLYALKLIPWLKMSIKLSTCVWTDDKLFVFPWIEVSTSPIVGRVNELHDKSVDVVISSCFPSTSSVSLL